MMRMPSTAILRALTADLRQIASVRHVTMADGPEAGVEALVFSTGGGLDFWVTAGRMLDIAIASWRGVQVGWQSPAGFRSPGTGDDAGRGFNGGFGGFLNTCGFDHIRQPAGGLPLHGSAPFTPARLLSFGADWDAAEPVLYCEGEVVRWRYGVGGHRLCRRIEAPIGGATIRIRDEIEVVGPEPAALVALYHFNLGFPLASAGAEILLDGAPIAGPLEMPEKAPAPPTLHAAAGSWASCRVVPPTASCDAVEFRWKTDTLPWLQLWRDLRPRCGVLSVEPCSAGCQPDGSNAPSEPFAPGEGGAFAIDIVFGSRAAPATS